MNEQITKKREWIKNAAIIFLAVMLILTFFSNTIMNMSLPEVATQYTNRGTITEKIRANGTLKAAQEYKVNLSETRTIESIAVKVGDKVSKGDVLFYLEDVDSKELSEAQTNLDKLESEYRKKLLSVDPENSSDSIDITNKQEDLDDIKNIDENLKLVEAAKNDVIEIERSIDDLKSQVADIDAQITVLSGDKYIDLDPENYKKLKDIKNRIDAQQKKVDENKKNLEDVEGKMKSGSTESSISSIRQEIEQIEIDISTQYTKLNATTKPEEISSIMDAIASKELQLKYKKEALDKALSTTSESYKGQYYSVKSIYDNSNSTLTSIKNELESAKKDIKEVLNGEKDKINSVIKDKQYDLDECKKIYEEKKTKYGSSREEAETKVQTAERELEKLIAKYNVDSGSSQIDIDDKKNEIEAQKKLVEKLKKEATSAKVTAQMGGTIKSISVSAGQSVEAQKEMAVIEINEQGYTFDYTVTKQQANKIKVGDEATVEYMWEGEATAMVSAIKPDPTNPGKSSIVSFSVTGDVSANQSVNVSIGGNSQDYDCVIPKSAVRTDSSGSFVYVVNSKNSPLGNRYYAEKVTVQVIASDDIQAAVSGLYGNEYILTTSNKPIENGTQVRLSTES